MAPFEDDLLVTMYASLSYSSSDWQMMQSTSTVGGLCQPASDERPPSLNYLKMKLNYRKVKVTSTNNLAHLMSVMSGTE